MRILMSLIVVVAIVGGGAAYYTTYIAAEPATTFRTVNVTRDNLLSTISATGTVEPEEVVDVGAQVVGRIQKFGADPSDPEGKKKIDFGSVVHEGTILANIDDSVYKAQLDQAQAQFLRSQADLKQMQAKLLQTQQELDRAKKLRPDKAQGLANGAPATQYKALSDSDYDLAVANYEVAKANVDVGAATIVQNAAALEMAKTNLGYTVIKSPVEGVIVARRVNIGQTVAGGSLNTPSLFLIAKDLKKMQVWAQVNEADIGRIRSRPDMPVRFTVDAYPGEVFHGKVAQIRLDAQMTQNVVLYTVVVAFDNSDLRLLPYMTANLQFEVEERNDVLLVPNAALRWKPRLEQVVPELRKEFASILAGRSGDRDSQNPERSPSEIKPARLVTDRQDKGRLWIKDGKFVRPVDVQIGATDQTQTEVSGDDVKEGMKVVVGEVRTADLAEGETNPFAPRLFRGRGGGGRGGR
jgi:HlyD family secretion protein